MSLSVGKPEYISLGVCGISANDFVYTPAAWVHRSEIYIHNKNFPLYFPLVLSRDEVGARNKLQRLINVLKEDTMKLYNSIIAKKRVLFIGYNHSADDVCSLVLASAEMVSAIVPNIIQRTYPYANLSDMSFLQVF